VWPACGPCPAPQMCGGAGTANVCGTPPPVVQSLTFSPNPVVGGNSTTGTVTLSGPAPPGGAVVTLTPPGVVTAPPSVTVPEGTTSTTYSIGTAVPANDA